MMFSNCGVATDGNEVEMIVLTKYHHGCLQLVENKDEEVFSPYDIVVDGLWTGLFIFQHLFCFIKFAWLLSKHKISQTNQISP